jgi:peptidoglycan/LPS O-acetylase OafA/YrhL
LVTNSGELVRLARLTGLDGLRAIAVLAVLIFHADSTLLPGGFLGVDLFFVISGYLITRLLLRELGCTNRVAFIQFYLRRALRLLPALVIVLVAVTVASTLVWRDELPTLRGTVDSSLGYVLNWWLIGAHESYFVASGRPPMLQHLWSLAIEEQFYLVWPVALALMTARRRRFGWVAGAALVLALASAGTMAAIAVRQGVPFAADSSRVYFGTDTHSMGLLLGAAMGAVSERLAFQPRRRWRVRIWPTDLIGAAALAGLGVLAVRVNEFMPGLYRGGFLGISALAVLVVSTVARPRSRLGRCLDWAPLRWLSDRSYAIYLWHWPVMVVTRPGMDLPTNWWQSDLIRVLVPLGLAGLSYHFVERPVRRFGLRWMERRRNLPVAPGRPRVWLPRVAGMTVLAAATLVLLALPPARTSRADAMQTAATINQAAAVPVSALATTPSATAGAASHAATRVKASAPKPAHAALAGSSARPALTAFGDSVMLGAQPALTSLFAQCAVHAVEGRQPYATLADVRQAEAAGALSSVVAIHTGNNGIIRASDLSNTLGQLRDRARVVLLTDRVPMDWQAPNNVTIKRVARSYQNVVVVDWYAESTDNNSWFYADGLHLRPLGAMRYAELIAHAVSR